MKTLLIATTNPGKLAEISKFLSDLPIRLIGLIEAGIHERVEETGSTFKENAITKAKFYAKKSGLPTLADDGGLEIDALGGEPGVKSHRWVHEDREDSDEDLIQYTLKRMRGLPRARRGAQLRAVLALALPNGEVHTAEGVIRGVIPVKPSATRIAGFPYRSLLYLPQINKFYNTDDLSPQENDYYNHRKKALAELKPIIKKFLQN